MRYLFSAIMLLSLSSCLIGPGQNSKIEVGRNSFFPQIIGIDLNGDKRDLPKGFAGKLNIVVVAFKREQQKNVDTWIPFSDQIIKENSAINFYEVPLIYELGAFSRAWVNNGMRLGVTDKVARKRTITVYTDRKKFFEVMKMKEEKIYVLLINDKGKILLREEGDFTDKKAKNISRLIKKISL